MSAASALESKLEAEVRQLQKLQNDLSKLIDSQQQLGAQFTENENVKKEFDSLGDDAVIYKLVGPVLVKQDTIEAKQNVEKRLEFIKGELTRIEKAANDTNMALEKKRAEAIKLQQQLQQARRAA